MEKQILFTFALLLFSKNTITMSAVMKMGTVTIQFTKEGCKDEYHKSLSYIIKAKAIKQGLSEQETKIIWIVSGPQQLNDQLGKKKLPEKEMEKLFTGSGGMRALLAYGDMLTLLKIKEELSLKITYIPDNDGKNIKPAKK